MLGLRLLIKSCLTKRRRTIPYFKNNIRSESWARVFMKRNNLTIRLSTNIKRKCVEISKESLQKYFTNIKNELENINQNVWKFDEDNLTDYPGKKRVIMKRGTKYLE